MIFSSSPVPELLSDSVWGLGVFYFSNIGNEVPLLGPGNGLLDAISYGNSTWAFDSSIPLVAEVHLLERYPPERDTNQVEIGANMLKEKT
jgi:hypothetical protein